MCNYVCKNIILTTKFTAFRGADACESIHGAALQLFSF